ncbi:hypothetical protein PPYR_08163 [Photinus pyralis]|uniref:acid phosphatase n=2 Tax=Photinus pyralis TaxID=7054 RepID=A0A5N4AIP8_PHOPY|nr:venom acid phosphatase Acph-1-like [Photinus pyralis]KAB0797169.1 hypothetical protein PPYR_08163 [Photinus pyralis]
MTLILKYIVNILIFLALDCMVAYCANEKTVQMVFGVFRHGDRTTDAGTLYPNDPYINETYEPYGLGELTNKGKMREYRLGQLLRARYALLLGKQYKKGKVRAVSTDYSRTQESLELVLASLYPPRWTQLAWNRWLNWNPIAYDIASHVTNRLLSIAILYCPRYVQLFDAYSKSEEGQQIESMFNSQYEYISNHSGLNVTKLFDLFRLYFCLVSESEWGLTLPEWTKQVFPGYLTRTTKKNYEMLVAAPQLNQLFGGFLLEDIISEMRAKMNENGTLKERKINLYSGHELNIAAILGAMDVFFPHIPPYGACVLIELHRHDDNYYVLIFYQDYSSMTLQPLTIPGCTFECPFEDFVNLLQKNLPDKQNGDPCLITGD